MKKHTAPENNILLNTQSKDIIFPEQICEVYRLFREGIYSVNAVSFETEVPLPIIEELIKQWYPLRRIFGMGIRQCPFINDYAFHYTSDEEVWSAHYYRNKK